MKAIIFNRNILVIQAFILSLVAAFAVTTTPQTASAACATALPTDRGTVTATVNVPATATYRVWSRIRTADATKNSFKMQIDDTMCNVSVGDASLTANQWTWVDYQNGSTTTKINAALTAGNHTVTMAGSEDNVEVDRVILTQDTACVPTGTGENCANPPDTTPPVVSISSPANGATITTTTTATAAASDDVAVTKVEFYVDGALATTDTSSPYNYSINPASISVGAHQLTAKAFDAANNSTTSSAVNFTIADTTAPTVSVSSPTGGSTQSGTIVVSATAADNVGVAKVEFYVDGSLKGTDNTSPFSLSIDTTTLTNASHALTAKAFDAANNSTTSAAVNITVNNAPAPDTTAPTVSMTAPASGATISGTYSLTANASDASGIKQVDFYVDNVFKGSDTTAPFSFSLNTSTLTNGTHAFRATAIDNSANQNTANSASVNATVSNATIRAEDINQDGLVNLLDFSILSNNFGKSGGAITNARADITGDGICNLLDFSRLANQYGK
jgi:hypothetical protein